MLLRAHSPGVERTWVAAVRSRCGFPSLASSRNGCEAHAVVEALAVQAGLGSTAGGREGRHSAQGSRGGPSGNARRPGQTTAGMRKAAPVWWECAAGGMNRWRRICSRAPEWHGPSDCVGCTGDTLAPRGRRADGVGEPGGSAALGAARRMGRTAAGWEGAQCRLAAEARRRRDAAVADAAAAAAAAAPVAGAGREQVAAAAEGGQGGGAGVESSRAVAVGGHRAQVVRRAGGF